MMRFIKLTNGMKEALVTFCMAHDECCCEYSDGMIRAMIDTAFEQLEKLNEVLPVSELSSYDLTVSGGVTGDIYPPEMAARNMISDEMVHLASFTLDEYISRRTDKVIKRGYDIIYDLTICEVIPVYTISITDEQVTSVYRVECSKMEDLDPTDFVISLAVQLSERMSNAAKYLGKVCDYPCA